MIYPGCNNLTQTIIVPFHLNQYPSYVLAYGMRLKLISDSFFSSHSLDLRPLAPLMATSMILIVYVDPGKKALCFSASRLEV